MKLNFILAGIMLLCSGCGHVMSEGGRQQVDTTIPYKTLASKPESAVGKTVMVGGILAGISGGGDVTTLEIAQLDLFSNGVPDEFSASTGRFLAISTELIDPLQLRPGALVTLIGTVKGKKVQGRDGSDYSYPLFAIKEIRFFRPSGDMPDLHPNPYSQTVGDKRFILSPPGLPEGEPRRLP